MERSGLSVFVGNCSFQSFYVEIKGMEIDKRA